MIGSRLREHDCPLSVACPLFLRFRTSCSNREPGASETGHRKQAAGNRQSCAFGAHTEPHERAIRAVGGSEPRVVLRDVQIAVRKLLVARAIAAFLGA